MIKANKNVSHNGKDYAKDQEVKDENHAQQLLKLGHADEMKPAAPVKPAKASGKVKADEPPAPVDEVPASFDDLEDEADDLPPAPAKPAAKPAAAKGKGKK